MKKAPAERWSVYILQCSDGTFYTGVSNDVSKRIRAHNEGKGAKYTRGRGPVELIAERFIGSHANALRLEAYIKRQPRDKKQQALSEWCDKS